VSAQVPVPAERPNPRGLPQPLARVCAALVAVGAAAFLYGLATDPATAWRAFHVNFVYYAALAQGGLLLAAIFVVVGAQWPGPVRRIAEGLAAWVPVSVLLGFVGILGGRHIFPWIEHPVEIKAAWLNPTRFYLTDLAILGVLALLSLRFLKLSVRPALGAAAESAPAAKGMFARWTAGWRGEDEERASCERQLRVLAPIICLLYAFGFTVIGFDQVMSIDPHWFSNLFGGYYAWGGFLSAVSATALIAVLHRNSPGLEGEITDMRMHDLGKMIFAFSTFWMYLFWAQYLVIWYGNLPEETGYLQARLGSQFLQDTWDFAAYRLNEPYSKLTLFVWACCWIVPFWVLLGQRPKRTPAILGSVAAIVCLGFWLERNVLVWPSLVPEDGGAWLGGLQIAIAAGFLGAFVLVYLAYTRVFPSLLVPRRS
jgi:hypothetical protein